MKKTVFKPIIFLLFLVLSFIVVTHEVEARRQMALQVRTTLRPVNWPQHQGLWFAPGVYWVDEQEGGVQSGTLDQTANLKIWNANYSAEFGRGFIRFERGGGVKEGTLVRDTELCVVNTASPNKQRLIFLGQQRVEFGYDGCVMKGTLAREAQLRTWDGKTNNYPKGTVVDFNGAGQVTRAVLPSGSPTAMDGAYQGTCSIVGIGSFPIRFTARNGAFEGLSDQNLFQLRYKGNYNSQGAISNGLLTGWIDDWDPTKNQKIRWTVRGPVTGNIKPTGSAGNVSATTSDGKITKTGTWNATRTGP